MLHPPGPPASCLMTEVRSPSLQISRRECSSRSEERLNLQVMVFILQKQVFFFKVAVVKFYLHQRNWILSLKNLCKNIKMISSKNQCSLFHWRKFRISETIVLSSNYIYILCRQYWNMCTWFIKNLKKTKD